ncbi:MAG: ABC transporter permease [Prochlorotrichaceae cyanobacterium]|jgi:iron(III) transport system permease protein
MRSTNSIAVLKTRLQEALRFSLKFCSQPWGWITSTIALGIALPILVVLSSIFIPQPELWSHLAATVLPRYLANSFWLSLGVSLGASVLGISTAWLVSMCQFPGRRFFEWGLLLPLAAPAYLLAYIYTDWLEYFGPVQRTLRQWGGWSSVNDYWFPPVRSLGGAIVLFSLVLYPYIYLITKVAFAEQGSKTLEASRSLGRTPWQSFFAVALPLARPAWMAGLALVLMETLNDFGTVQFFGVETFTTGIYRTWFGLGERLGATQLAAVLLLGILSLLLLELWGRRQSQYYHTDRPQSFAPYRLQPLQSLLAIVTCGLPIVLGLVVPGILLVLLTVENWDRSVNAQFWDLIGNSLVLALLTGLFAVILGLILGYGVRLNPQRLVRGSVRLVGMGYAIPGAVIAVGLLLPVSWLDRSLELLQQGVQNPFFLSGTAIVLVVAYLVRFLAVALGAIESSLARISPNLDQAARSLGLSPLKTLLRVHVPLLRGGLLTAMMLVFVDVMKELPATIVLRPFNFDTLAVRVYQYASDERLAEAAAPALTILLVGLLPVIALSWQIIISQQQRSTPEEG